MDRVEVNHEWETLREAVCGIPHFKIPTTLASAVYNYAPAEGIAFMEANLGKSLDKADPALYATVAAQMDAAVPILEGRGVRPPSRPHRCRRDARRVRRRAPRLPGRLDAAGRVAGGRHGTAGLQRVGDDEQTIMIASGLDELAAGLRSAGQEVVETPFDAVYRYAGAFRCWHHPLHRESSL